MSTVSKVIAGNFNNNSFVAMIASKRYPEKIENDENTVKKHKTADENKSKSKKNNESILIKPGK